jgi:peptidoglycan/LPS O-acetylase OafA/YrhL
MATQIKEEILTINLLRFLAALSVFLLHEFSTLVDYEYIPRTLGFLQSVTQYGYLGVNLFFLISGFVITLSSEGRTFGQFVSARFIRLYPVFWMCVSISSLFIVFTSQDQKVSLTEYLANLTMVPGFFGGYSFIDGVYWTLQLELKFYVLIALIVLFKPFITISLQKVASIASLLLAYDALSYYSTISATGGFVSSIFYFNNQSYTQYFIAGILFYGIYKKDTRQYHYVSLFVCYVTALLQVVGKSAHPFVVTAIITTFFIVFLLLALRKITNNIFPPLFFGQDSRIILIKLGALTYPLYLLHNKLTLPIILTFNNYGVPPFLAGPLYIFVLMSAVLMVNALDYYINFFWKKSFILKKLLIKVSVPFLKKIF